MDRLQNVLPVTGAELGVRDRRDPDDAVAGGADYLARHLIRFAGLRLALAADSAGPARVARLSPADPRDPRLARDSSSQAPLRRLRASAAAAMWRRRGARR